MNRLLFGSIQTIRLLLLVALSTTVYAVDPKTYIPPQAFTHKETIRTELDKHFNYIPTYNYVPALIEHESCISLKHSRCWNSTSELRTKREQGLGLSQVTRAFREDGTVRFDVLTDMRKKYLAELKEANWDTFKHRPDLQIRLTVLLLRDNWRALRDVEDPMARLHMTDAAYNGGIGWIQRERRACGLAKDCNPGLWFDNTERYCLRSKKVIYGNRSVCDIAAGHPSDVFKNRLPKYEKQYFVKEN